jgi:hypothetical protein
MIYSFPAGIALAMPPGRLGGQKTTLVRVSIKRLMGSMVLVELYKMTRHDEQSQLSQSEDEPRKMRWLVSGRAGAVRKTDSGHA